MNSTRAALMQGAVDRQAGEDILIEPMAAPAGDVNARRVADGSRAACAVTGVWTAPQIEFARRPHEHVESRGHSLNATRPMVKIQTVLLPYALCLGDRVTRVATGERGETALVGSDGYGRTILSLTALKAASNG
jgi:hypothetical protein